jgi:hypothetical protein
MASQGELFAAPPIVPGLVLVEDAVSEAEEAAIAAHVDAAPLAPFEFGQWRGKRLTVNYGSAYDYQRARPRRRRRCPAGWPSCASGWRRKWAATPQRSSRAC